MSLNSGSHQCYYEGTNKSLKWQRYGLPYDVMIELINDTANNSCIIRMITPNIISAQPAEPVVFISGACYDTKWRSCTDSKFSASNSIYGIHCIDISSGNPAFLDSLIFPSTLLRSTKETEGSVT